MASSLKGPPGSGYRRRPAGVDQNMKHFEARLREAIPKSSPSASTPGALGAPPEEVSRAESLSSVIPEALKQRHAWSDLLPPKVNWWYREILVTSGLATTITELVIDVETIPRGSSLVILEFTPIILRKDPIVANPTTWIEEPSYRYFGRIFCTLNYSGQTSINASSTEVTQAGAFTRSIPGTSIYNVKAFTADPTFPMALYVSPNSTLNITFQFFDHNGTAQQLGDIQSGLGNATPAFGAKLLGFYIDNKYIVDTLEIDKR